MLHKEIHAFLIVHIIIRSTIHHKEIHSGVLIKYRLKGALKGHCPEQMADGQCAELFILSSILLLGECCIVVIVLYIYSVPLHQMSNLELGAAGPGSQRSNQNQLSP